MMAANAPNPNNNDRVGTFQEKTVPAEARLAGWAWLVHRLGVQAPVRCSSVVSDQHVKASFRKEGGWTIYDKRYWPGDGFGDHLGFALRHENLDLLVLKRLYDAVPQDTVTALFAVPQQEHPIGAPGFSTNS